MKVYERFNELNVFGENQTVENILGRVYNNRIYISDVLEQDLPMDLIEATEVFMASDVEYDGDEKKAWERFLNMDMEYLIEMDDYKF